MRTASTYSRDELTIEQWGEWVRSDGRPCLITGRPAHYTCLPHKVLLHTQQPGWVWGDGILELSEREITSLCIDFLDQIDVDGLVFTLNQCVIECTPPPSPSQAYGILSDYLLPIYNIGVGLRDRIAQLPSPGIFSWGGGDLAEEMEETSRRALSICQSVLLRLQLQSQHTSAPFDEMVTDLLVRVEERLGIIRCTEEVEPAGPPPPGEPSIDEWVELLSGIALAGKKPFWDGENFNLDGVGTPVPTEVIISYCHYFVSSYDVESVVRNFSTEMAEGAPLAAVKERFFHQLNEIATCLTVIQPLLEASTSPLTHSHHRARHCLQSAYVSSTPWADPQWDTRQILSQINVVRDQILMGARQQAETTLRLFLREELPLADEEISPLLALRPFLRPLEKEIMGNLWRAYQQLPRVIVN